MGFRSEQEWDWVLPYIPSEQNPIALKTGAIAYSSIPIPSGASSDKVFGKEDQTSNKTKCMDILAEIKFSSLVGGMK